MKGLSHQAGCQAAQHWLSWQMRRELLSLAPLFYEPPLWHDCRPRVPDACRTRNYRAYHATQAQAKAAE